MLITLNGQPRNLADSTSLQSLVSQVSPRPELVIAEKNGQIIDRTSWDTTLLQPNDKVELVSFVGGG